MFPLDEVCGILASQQQGALSSVLQSARPLFFLGTHGIVLLGVSHHLPLVLPAVSASGCSLLT